MKQSTALSIFSIILFFTFLGCSDSEEKQLDSGKETTIIKEDLASKIEAIEDSLTRSSQRIDAKTYSIELLRLSTEFVAEFPKDQRCADYYFMGARAAIGLGEINKSLHMMKTMKKVYSNYSKMPEVYFLYAFTLDEELNKKEEAKEAYTQLINEFPDNPLSAQAIVLMEQLYMTDEQLIEMWDKQEQN